MTTLKAHFDGKVLVPDEPVNLPVNCDLKVHVEPTVGQRNGKESAGESGTTSKPLMELVKKLEALPDDPDSPTDGAAQHDHYLYGLPKRP